MVHNCLFEIAGVDKGQFEVIREIPTFKIKDQTCEQSCMISCHDRKLLLITPIIHFFGNFAKNYKGYSYI